MDVTAICYGINYTQRFLIGKKAAEFKFDKVIKKVI
jgi:hypothetical protein